MTKKKFFLILRDQEKIRFRNVFRLLGAKEINDFMVQLEIEISPNNWKGVIRYDLKHGYFHRDLIYANTHKYQKEIPSQGLEDAIVIAIDDLKENFHLYLRKAGYNISYPALRVTENLEEAKQYILALIKQPESIEKVLDQIILGLKPAIITSEYKLSVTKIKGR
jgi:hypothetical protein